MLSKKDLVAAGWQAEHKTERGVAIWTIEDPKPVKTLRTDTDLAGHPSAWDLPGQADPDGESAIWLQDQQALTPRNIVGEIAQAIRQQRPAFVFNACEVGHQGWTINGLGGWASRLIGAGAGLFLAPLWPVNDRSAYRCQINLKYGVIITVAWPVSAGSY